MDASTQLVSLNVELIALLCVVVGGGWAFYSKISQISMLIGKRAAEIDNLDARSTSQGEDIKTLHEHQTEVLKELNGLGKMFAVNEERQRAMEKRQEEHGDVLKDISRQVTGTKQ